MNILFIVSGLYLNGVTTYITMLSQSFIDAGHKPYTISFSSGGNVPGMLFNIDIDHSIVHTREFQDDLCSYILDLESVLGKFDLVLTNLRTARLATRRMQDRWNIYAIGHDPLLIKKDDYQGYRIIGVSDYVCNRACRYGFNVKKRIYPPFHQTIADVRSIGGTNVNDYVYFPHRMVDKKGVSFIHDIKDEIDCLIMASCKKSNDVICVERKPFPYYRYKNARVTLQLSVAEPFGYCIVESLYLGTPVVLFTGGGSEEIVDGWIDKDCIVPYGNVDGIISAINNIDYRVHLPSAFFQRFDPQKIAEEYIALI